VTPNDLLRAGIAAAKAGQRERARDLLTRAIEQDERNISAWLWLSGVVDSLEDREICLDNVLALDPNNAHAHKGLAWVREQAAKSDLPPLAPAPESPMVARARTPVSPAAAILRGEEIAPEPEQVGADDSSIAAILHEELARSQLPSAPEQKPLPTALQDEFNDEYLCPYCAALTEPDDRKCNKCSGELWIKFRRQEKRSKWLWIAMGLQFPGLMGSLAGFGLLLIYIAAQANVANPFDLLSVYLGLPNNLPPVAASAALELLPRPLFFLATLPTLVSLTMFGGLYARWRPIYYLYWISAVSGFIFSIVGMFLQQGYGIIAGVVGAFFALLTLLLVFRLEDDFKIERRRILLRADRGLGSAADFVAQGDFYARQKKWALSAIHLRQAVGLFPNRLDSRIALAVAYARLKRYDLATRELAEAKRINPKSPRVEEMMNLVDSLRSQSDPL